MGSLRLQNVVNQVGQSHEVTFPSGCSDCSIKNPATGPKGWRDGVLNLFWNYISGSTYTGRTEIPILRGSLVQ